MKQGTQAEAAAPGQPALSLGQRLRQTSLGPLPVLIGLLGIALYFQFRAENFLTPLNITNLFTQIAAMGTMSAGVVLVLLLGEVDLSVGSVSGFCAALMVVLMKRADMADGLALTIALIVGLLIGALHGFWTAWFKVPSFVVTLAGLMMWQGAMLAVLGSEGSQNLPKGLIANLANTMLPLWLGWLLVSIGVGLYALLLLLDHRRRQQAELPTSSTSWLLLRIGLVASGALIAVAMMSVNRNNNQAAAPIQGVPLSVLLFVLVLVVFDFITRRMRFGRYIYAVGGNVEAARRAGINVLGIRVTVFALCSLLAAFGGILTVSRNYAISQSSGGGDVLLNAIAAAVIGGTSLFGGRGRVWSALLGALVIGSIANGMDLIGVASAQKFVVTGIVLLAAVTIDAVARARRENTGR